MVMLMPPYHGARLRGDEQGIVEHFARVADVGNPDHGPGRAARRRSSDRSRPCAGRPCGDLDQLPTRNRCAPSLKSRQEIPRSSGAFHGVHMTRVTRAVALDMMTAYGPFN
jgi:hypothetical protein